MVYIFSKIAVKKTPYYLAVYVFCIQLVYVMTNKHEESIDIKVLSNTLKKMRACGKFI